MPEEHSREHQTSEIDPEKDPLAARIDDPAPTDPGGAHAKGYSADSGPEDAVAETDPVPLAPGPTKHPAVQVPERDNHVRPTGRGEPGDYKPNDRLMGSDR